jgi:hexulose-6-phosphate isomerase
MSLPDKIGIMQGRLSPRIDGKIQAYPEKTWQKEFELASQIGYSHIEWIVENPLQRNALFSTEGIAEIKKVIAETRVTIQYICADIFMQQPLFENSEELRIENNKIFRNLVTAASQVGAIGIEIPFVDNSSIKNIKNLAQVKKILGEFLEIAKENGIKISLETDLAPNNFKNLLEELQKYEAFANYDIGNSASLGFNPEAELDAYADKILNLHIKDRELGGYTVPLGTGNADIELVLSKLNKINYQGGITMQAARGDDDIKTAIEQLNYVKKILESLS